MIARRTRVVTAVSENELRKNLAACAPDFDAIYSYCAGVYPGFGLSTADLQEALIVAVEKYLIPVASKTPSASEIRNFISELQYLDLFLAVACVRGNETAWWEFDRQHRPFIERWARHLIRSGTEADEVIDSVYVELFGTKVVDGVRQSKFRTFTGRGTLRGWLRTVILHAVVDLYRGRKADVPLEDWMEASDEPRERPAETHGGEDLMLASVVRERYRSATVAALDQSLAALDDHETLLLFYYHVEGLKLREIARVVEQPRSPIRRWFQRQSTRRASAPGRVHESTVMRWLEKVYQKVSERFHAELAGKHGLNPAEIEICKAIAAEDSSQEMKLNRSVAGSGDFKATETRPVEGA